MQIIAGSKTAIDKKTLLKLLLPAASVGGWELRLSFVVVFLFW
jgi:hypothetical protein